MVSWVRTECYRVDSSGDTSNSDFEILCLTFFSRSLHFPSGLPLKREWGAKLEIQILSSLCPSKLSDHPQTLCTCSTHEFHRFWEFEPIPMSLSWQNLVFQAGIKLSPAPRGVAQNDWNHLRAFRTGLSPQTCRIALILGVRALLTSSIDSERLKRSGQLCAEKILFFWRGSSVSPLNEGAAKMTEIQIWEHFVWLQSRIWVPHTA